MLSIPVVLGLALLLCAAPMACKMAPHAARESALLDDLRRLWATHPVTVGHRGASQRLPENTLPAFTAALDAGAEMIELDVRETADGEWVCIHDATVARTTDAERRLGADAAVAQLSLATLTTLDAGAWKGAEHAGAKIPTLQEALDLIQPRGTTMIERKAGSAHGLVEMLRASGHLEDVLVQAFDWQWLQEVHALEPRLTLGALCDDPWRDGMLAEIAATGASFVHWNATAITADDVARFHAHDYPVCVYTVNADLHLLGTGALGLDMVTTNVPARMRALIEAGSLRR